MLRSSRLCGEFLCFWIDEVGTGSSACLNAITRGEKRNG